MEELRRPEVVLVRSSAPLVLEPFAPKAPPRRSWTMLALTAFLLLVAGTSTGAEVSAAPEPLRVGLVAVDGLTVSQSGVLVVPLELSNAGRTVTVGASEVYAEPVRQDARVSVPRDVEGGAARGVVALLAPDCRLLRAGSPIEFRATVRVRVARAGREQDLHVDLGSTSAVRRSVAGLCG